MKLLGIPLLLMAACLGPIRHPQGPSAAERALLTLGTLPVGVVYHSPLADARVLSRFGQRGRSFHCGIDLKGWPQGGDVVLASREGVVEVARSVHGFGRLVAIRHVDGWRTRYGHLKKFFVQEGQLVQAGEEIGLVGRSGRATTAHLHFEILSPRGEPVDPGKVLFKK